MPTPPVTKEEFKARFDREFDYGSTLDKVRDADITNALTDATMVFNSALWADALEKKTAFLFASAHFLVLNMQAAGGLSLTAGKGINSRGGGVISSKSVGSVSVSFALPARLVDNPLLNQFMRTDFGQKYLQLLTPRMVGNVGVVEGWRNDGSGE